MSDYYHSRLHDLGIAATAPFWARKRAILRKLKPVGAVLYLTGMFRLHVDGDGLSGVFRWWHPLSWLAVLAAIPVCAVVGEKLSDVVPFRPSKFWRKPENLARIEWV